MTLLDKPLNSDASGNSHPSALHVQAAELLAGRQSSARTQSYIANAADHHTVEKNESLYSIARGNLIAHGAKTASEKAIMAEVERIVELNCDRYRDLKTNPSAIHEGWILRLNKEQSVNTATKDKQRQNLSPEEQANGVRIVRAGDSLHSIAREQLALRGGNPKSASALESEINRIIANNKDRYPSLEKNREHIELGWKLKVEDNWNEAEPSKMTLVKRGEKIIGSDNTWLVIEPGGRAILNAGARGFLAEGGTIERAMPGSMVIADGGEIEDYGATILAKNPKVKIHSHRDEATEH